MEEDIQPIIIRDEVLVETFVPTRMLHREGQMQELARCLNPVLDGKRAMNVFLYGPPGTGKTSLIKWMFDQLEERSLKFKPIYINCWERQSKHAVVSAMAAAINPFISTKRTAGEVLEEVLENITRKELNVVVCLDEIDRMMEKDLLYDLSRNRIGLVLISNDPHALVDLDARIKSSLLLNFVEFPKYKVDELVDILKDRVELALRPNSIQNELLRVIAVSSEGDARVAIATLRNAALYAEAQGKPCITKDEILKAIKNAKKLKIEQILSTLNNEQVLLYRLVEEAGELDSAKLFEMYKQKSKDPVSERTYRNYMEKLVSLKLVRAEGDVRWRRYKVVM